jgi:hypothetical protein
MATNFPGPYELRIKYADTVLSPVIQHTQRLNVSLVEPAAQGDVFGNYDINDKNGATTVDLATVVEAWLAKLNATLDADVSILSVELWKYPTPQSFDSVFWSTYTPVANVGTAGGPTVASSQNILTFRTSEGGIMKLSVMESDITPGQPRAYADMNAAQKGIVDFVLDGDGATFSAPFLGRDTSYPFSVIAQYPGQNERLWKKRNGR